MSLELVFITSSKMKLEHAQHLCKDYNVNIISYRKKHYGVGYDEPRIYNREQLLEESYNDALLRWNKYTKNQDNMFIIEDTSVRIDALSSEEKEIPGLDIKYWMKDNTFETVDKQLKLKNNNRKCTVRSDVILHLSKDLQKELNKKYMHFTSSTDGTIIEKERNFNTNLMYPWLDNKTFNKWFIPNNNNRPMSMLSIKNADKHDFRAGAFKEMLDFLDSVHKIPNNSYVQGQFYFEPLYICCGPTCAGKSTLSKYLADNYGYYHIEASDFMWLKYHQKHGVKFDIKIGDFAKKALSENPSIVTEQIIKFIKENGLKKIIISGFRSDKEIEFMRNWDDDLLNIIEVYIDSNIDIRFDRQLKRNRKDAEPIKENFIKKDTQQFSMGLNIIRDKINNKIINEDTIENLFNNFEVEYVTTNRETFALNINKRYKKIRLENAILLALYKYENKYHTTTEISKIINSEIVGENCKKHKDNISRYFNQNFYPYYDIDFDKIKEVKKYKINFTGISQLKFVFKSL